jgi:hypothetical protein
MREMRVTVIEKTKIVAEVFQREFGALPDEMRAGFAEMRKEFVEVRKDMQVGFANVRKEMQAQDGALRVEIAKTPFETFKWLLAAGGLAAAMATAIYNIGFR